VCIYTYIDRITTRCVETKTFGNASRGDPHGEWTGKFLTEHSHSTQWPKFANCVLENSSTSWESQTLPLSIIGKKSALFVHTFGALYLETSRKWKSRIRKWKPRIAWRRTCHFTLCLPVWLSVIVYLLKIEVHPSWNRTVENKWFDLRSYCYIYRHIYRWGVCMYGG